MTTKHKRREGRYSKVLWASPEKPFAFILDPRTGETFFVHRNDLILQPGEALPVVGDHCSFEIGSYNARPVAILVRKSEASRG